MFEFIGQTVAGGWDAISNLGRAAAGQVQAFTSPFFPTPQKISTQSQIVQPVENVGLTYRPTLPEAQSIIETAAHAAQGWLGSPQEPILAVQAKRDESKALASQISSTTQTKKWSDNIVDFFGWTMETLGEAKKIKTVVDEVMWDFGLKERPEIIKGTPREGYPEGRDESHIDTGQPTGADILGIMKGVGSAFLDQVKGLFNLGYSSPEGAQPAFSIKHELKPTTGTTIGIIAIVGVLILVVILGRKK